MYLRITKQKILFEDRLNLVSLCVSNFKNSLTKKFTLREKINPKEFYASRNPGTQKQPVCEVFPFIYSYGMELCAHAVLWMINTACVCIKYHTRG